MATSKLVRILTIAAVFSTVAFVGDIAHNDRAAFAVEHPQEYLRRHYVSIVPPPENAPGLTNSCYRRSLGGSDWLYTCRYMTRMPYAPQYESAYRYGIMKKTRGYITAVSPHKKHFGRSIHTSLGYSFEGCRSADIGRYGSDYWHCKYRTENHWMMRTTTSQFKYYFRAGKQVFDSASCAWQLSRFWKGSTWDWNRIQARCGTIQE